MVHPFGIGDAVLITPVIRSLKESGVKKIDLLLGSRTKMLFENNPHVSQIFVWDKSPVARVLERWRRFREVVALFWKLWRNHYQVMFDFSVGGQYAFLSWIFFWIPVRIGFNFRGRGIFLTHKLELREGYAEKSVAEYYLDLLHFLAIRPTNKKPEFFLSEADHQECETILKKFELTGGGSYLAVVPGGGESWGQDARLKRWPVEYFGKLIRELHRTYGGFFEKVLILGGSNEHHLGTELLQEFSGLQVHNLCGMTSIRVTAALIQKASFLLANDGGLVHVAHALGTPLIAIYGPVDPLAYGPYPPDSKALTVTNSGPACRPCYQRFKYQADCKGVECLNHLTVDRVLEQIKSTRFFEQRFTASVLK